MRRLGKQRVEAMQILHCLLGIASTSWHRHPAVRMWHGHEQALAAYGFAVCEVWRERGYHDTALNEFDRILETMPSWSDDCLPPWFGDAAFHASHRSNLLRKDLNHYSKFGWSEPTTLPYLWPETTHDAPPSPTR